MKSLENAYRIRYPITTCNSTKSPRYSSRFIRSKNLEISDAPATCHNRGCRRPDAVLTFTGPATCHAQYKTQSKRQNLREEAISSRCMATREICSSFATPLEVAIFGFCLRDLKFCGLFMRCVINYIGHYRVQNSGYSSTVCMQRLSWVFISFHGTPVGTCYWE